MKKIFTVLLLGLFLISFSSAFEFDNTYNYNSETETAVIHNCDFWLIGCLNEGEVLAEVTLTSPHNKKVTRGIDVLVGEFNLTTTGDFQDVFGEMFLIDMKNGNEISRGKQYKYKEYKNISVDDYETTCENIISGNGTIYQECTQEEIGSHVEIQMDWIPIINPTNIFYSGITYEIGTFVDVEKDDYGDWRPKILGVDIPEWSTWTEDLNVGIVSYYKLDESSGTAYDSLGLYNLTNTGVTMNQAGLIETSGLYNVGTSDKLKNANFDNTFNTVNMWVYLTSMSNFATLWTMNDGFDDVSVYHSNGLVFSNYNGSGVATTAVSMTSYLNKWTMVTALTNDTHMKLYLDGSEVGNALKNLNTLGTVSFTIGNHISINRAPASKIDEVGVWARALSQSEITQLNNSGAGITWIDNFGIAVIQNYPENNSLINNPEVDFNWTITPGLTNITNWTLNVFNINGTLDHQHINTSINTNQIVTIIHNDTLLIDRSYLWSVEACSIDNNCNTPINFTFTLDTAPPVINITYPQEGFIVNNPQQNITLNYTVFHPVGNLSNCFYNSTSNSTPINISCITNTTSFLYPISSPDNLTIFVFGNDTAGNLGYDNVTIFKDMTSPQINITAPIEILDFNYVGNNETLNWTVTDEGLESCWYNYNSTNVTVNCSLNTTNFIIMDYINQNLTFYANDTFSNLNSSFTSWEYKILEINQTFNNISIEGNTQNISATIKLNNGLSISSVVLDYNGTLSTGTFSTSNKNVEIIKSNFITPPVSIDTNVTFKWSIVLSGGEIINLTERNQTISNINIDNCSVFTNEIINITIIDEEEQTIISNNTVLEISINVLSSDRTQTIISFSQEFEDTNPISICLDINISQDITYSLDSIIRYTATGYANEYYNIVDQELTNQTETTSLTLFSLNETRSTEFQLTFKGEDFLPTEDALIFVERQYISEDTFKTVELPKTDVNGQTVLHLVRNSVLYNIRIVKDNQVLKIFNNVIAFCQDFTIGNCVLNLNAISNESGVFNYDNSVGITYNSVPQYNQTSKVVSFSFASTDGSAENIFMNVERRDIFGNRSICNNTIVSSSGTLSCTITEEIDDTTLFTTVSVNTKEWLTFSTIIDDTAYGSIGYVFWFFLTLALILMFGESKNGVMIAIFASYVGGVGLGIAIGGVIGIASGGIWILVITLVGIYKINKNRKR